MGIFLTKRATEQSTYVITLSYLDSAGSAVTPDSVTWTLTDLDGTVINSREDVAIGSPSTTNDIVLSGDDLQIGTNDNGGRIITIEGVYDSDEGNNLPLKEVAKFYVDALKVVS